MKGGLCINKNYTNMAAKVISSVFRPGLFRGKNAIVTGGGTGIGKAITSELLYLGKEHDLNACHPI